MADSFEFVFRKFFVLHNRSSFQLVPGFLTWRGLLALWQARERTMFVLPKFSTDTEKWLPQVFTRRL